MRIALSTGGGDAPGLNAVIRAAVLASIDRGWDVCGIRKGYAGLLGDDDVVPLTRDSVRASGTWVARSSAPRIAAIPFTTTAPGPMARSRRWIGPTS